MHSITMIYIDFLRQIINLAEDLLLLPQLSLCGCRLSFLNQIKDGLHAPEIQLRFVVQF